MLDFWASWCVPCRAENPNAVKAYRRYKNHHFTVLSVSLDSDEGKWIKAIHHDHLTWTNLISKPGNNTLDQYDLHAIPVNFLIDPRGVIIAKNLRGEMLEKRLAELIKE